MQRAYDYSAVNVDRRDGRRVLMIASIVYLPVQSDSVSVVACFAKETPLPLAWKLTDDDLTADVRRDNENNAWIIRIAFSFSDLPVSDKRRCRWAMSAALIALYQIVGDRKHRWLVRPIYSAGVINVDWCALQYTSHILSRRHFEERNCMI